MASVCQAILFILSVGVLVQTEQISSETPTPKITIYSLNCTNQTIHTRKSISALTNDCTEKYEGILEEHMQSNYSSSLDSDEDAFSFDLRNSGPISPVDETIEDPTDTDEAASTDKGQVLKIDGTPPKEVRCIVCRSRNDKVVFTVVLVNMLNNSNSNSTVHTENKTYEFEKHCPSGICHILYSAYTPILVIAVLIAFLLLVAAFTISSNHPIIIKNYCPLTHLKIVAENHDPLFHIKCGRSDSIVAL